MIPSAEGGAGGLRRGVVRLVPVALALLAAGLAWRHRDALLAGAASPETQVREVLAHQARATLDGPGGAHAELRTLRFGDVAVQVDGGRARVLAVVEGQGTVGWDGQEAELGYIGREAFAMVRCPGARWCPDGPQLPELGGVVEALRGRAAPPAARIRAWQIRVERDRATAGEDYVVGGGGADVAERRRAVYTLRRAGAGWVFVEPD